MAESDGKTLSAPDSSDKSSLLFVSTGRFNFWDKVEDDYEVKMTCLKDVASEGLTTGVHVFTAEPESVVAHGCRVLQLDFNKITVDQLKQVKVRTATCP